MAKANPERALRDLYELRQIGAYKTGVHRPTLSKEDMIARTWLVEKLRAFGHDAHIDGIANVFGKAPGSGPHVLSGSHIESQNHAGWLDGALGVIFALEAARAAAEDPELVAHGKGVDVIAFADEEGHFGQFLGSYSFLDELDEATIDDAADRSGRGRLRHLLAENGLSGVDRVRMEPARYRAFFEAHIEQGGRLEREDFSVGIVTSIVAIWQYRITVTGAQNHAGTTTMAERRDAGKTLMRIWQCIEDRFPDLGAEHSVWTTGRVELFPGGPSIIPGKAVMHFQLRDADLDVLNRMQAGLSEIVDDVASNSPCTAVLETLDRSTPAHMAEMNKQALIDAAEANIPGRGLVMPSGAGHDAQNMARHLPSGMMFVPSIGGISHHWSENTSDADILTGATVFVDAIDRVLRMS